AVKVIKTQKEGKNEVVLSIATVREIKILREMHHDNVVHLHDVHVDPKATSLALVFDYADHDLHDIIKQSRQKPLTEYTKKSFMHQILKGVKYMHDNWVMHRDMKPQNILVVGHGRRRGQVKLAGNFGLARIYKDPIKALTEVERVVVTLWYRAPELLLGSKHYTKAVDMWAVGCIFAEILNTRELFMGQEVNDNNAPFQKDQCDKIFKILGLPTPQTWTGMDNLPEYSNVQAMTKEREYPTTSKLHEAVKFGTGHSSVLLRDLIARLLYYGPYYTSTCTSTRSRVLIDPENRITATEALAHDYFKCEPYPRDYAFDEPNKEPIHFQKQKVKPLEEPVKPAASPADAGGKDNDDDGTVGEAVVSVISRSVLVQSAHTIVDDQRRPDVSPLAKYFEDAYPKCFESSHSSSPPQIAVKSVRTRLRSPKEKAAALGRFAAMDAPALLAAKQFDTSDTLSLLIGDNSVSLGLLVASGLSPSSGGRGGRTGGGIAATFSLNQRPFTGVTTMDPELALVMANMAKVVQGDVVLDPFAGSCGVLLACAYFGMGMGLGQDICEATLRGEGPGRTVHSNFEAFGFAVPEMSLCDVRASSWRKTWTVDAIVSDPPYGIRTFGATESEDGSRFDDQYVAHLVRVWSPHLVAGGRMVFYVCGPSKHKPSLVSYLTDLLLGSNLGIVDVIETGVHFMDNNSSIDTAAWTRSLVVLEKRSDSSSHRHHLPLLALQLANKPQTSASSRNLPWTVSRNMEPLDIWRAAWLGDISSLEKFVADKGGDINAPDDHGKTALYFASGYNQLRVVAFLAAIALDVDAQDVDEKTALVQAARHGHAQVVRLLLKAGADPCKLSSKRWSPAYFAATYGHLEVLLALYEASPASLMLPGPGHATAIHRAAERGHATVVERLISLHPPLATSRDWLGRTYIAYAARHGHVNVLELFPLQSSDPAVVDHDGNTPLHEAVRYGRLECAQWLLDHHEGLKSVKNKAGDEPKDVSKAPDMQRLFTSR
ncbi:hypothetical protein DYB31_008594, partial [Aphanomyces astaci]